MNKNFFLAVTGAFALMTGVATAQTSFTADAFVIKPAGAAQYEVSLEGETQNIRDTGFFLGGKVRFLDLGAVERFDVEHYYAGYEFTNGVWLSFGKQVDTFEPFNGGLRELRSTALANPVSGEHSAMVGVGPVAALVGIDNIGDSTRSIRNVQGIAQFDTNMKLVQVVTVGVDYQLATNVATYAVATHGAIGNVDVSATITHSAAFGYEVGAGYKGFNGFVAGTPAAGIVDVGVGYTHNVNEKLTVWGETVYNVTTKSPTVAAGVSFNF